MPRFRSGLLLLPLLLGATIVGCEGDSSGPDGAGGEGGQGGFGGAGSSLTTVRKTLGQDGGRLQTSNVSLFVPSGALTKNTELTVSELDQAAINELPETTDGIKLSGIPAKFTPHGLSFEQSAEVTMNYDEPDDADEPLAVLKLDNDQDTTWEYVPGGKFESGSASFPIDGFSIYCVFADPNGIADMIYAPESGGTGGSVGTGGTGSGGEPASGGAPSTGGSGGTGGDIPGYLNNDSFHGFGDTEAGPGASIEDSDLETLPGPNCISGFTGANTDDTATLVYNVNQEADASAPEPTSVSDAGLRLSFDFVDYRSMMIELRGETASWCTWANNEVPGPTFIEWETFDSYNCAYDGAQSLFDPETDEIVSIAVTVRSDGTDNSDFAFCLEELTSGLPNSYLEGPTWQGHGFYGSLGPTTNPTSNLSDQPAPHCIEGTLDPSPSAYGELGYNLNEPVGGGADTVTLAGSGLALDLTNEPARDVRIVLWTPSTADSDFCWESTGPLASGPLDPIPWDDFVDCNTGAVFSLATPVTSISVRALSNSIADDPFKLCIESMDQEL